MTEKFLRLHYPSDLPILKVDVVEKKENEDFLEFCYKSIDCNLIEFAVFTGEGGDYCFEMIVDEEGLLKSGNYVSCLRLTVDGKENELHLAGNILIGGVIYEEEEGYKNVGLTDEQIEFLMENLLVSLYGRVK